MPEAATARHLTDAARGGRLTQSERACEGQAPQFLVASFGPLTSVHDPARYSVKLRCDNGGFSIKINHFDLTMVDTQGSWE
jgi:hypothetical protein